METRRLLFHLRVLVPTLVLFLQPCLKVGQPIFSFPIASALQRQGPGAGGGGGDYHRDLKPSSDEVRRAIEEARETVPFVLNHLESVITNARSVGTETYLSNLSTPDGAIPSATYRLLFPWPGNTEDAQAKWARTTLNIEEAKSCYDDSGNEKAASAIPLTSSQICVSIPRIQETAVRANLVQRITALFIHELSHKMGVTDHLQIETSLVAMLPAESSLVLHSPKEELLQSLVSAEEGFVPLVDETLQLVKSSRTPDWSSVCYNLASMSALAKNFGEPDLLNGVALALLRPSLEAEKQAIYLRTRFFAAYCTKQSQVGLVQTRFGNRNEVPVNLGGTGVLSIARGTLRKPEFKNASLLKAELEDIKRSLLKILSALR